MSEETNGADVNLEIGGQKVNVRNVKSLNTLATVASLLGVILLCYVVWEHKMDASAQEVKRESAAAQRDVLLTSAIKEMAAAQKEGVVAQRVMNCLLSTDQKDRRAQLDTCERIAR